MKEGYLSDYFSGIGAKRLTPAEVDPKVSNQHEFQGVKPLKKILGTSPQKERFPTHFLWMADEEQESLSSFVTWSDVRRDKKKRSAEYHLYYSAEAEDIVYRSKPNDLLIICKAQNEELLIIICPEGSSIEKQLVMLFGISSNIDGFDAKIFENDRDKELTFASKFILNEIGIEVEEADDTYLDKLLGRFGESFPSTKVFSKFARDTFPHNISHQENPDEAILEWIDYEEKLFKTFEEYLVTKRLDKGFNDVETFISFSLSVQNRRKSRMGYALENHLHKILDSADLNFSHNPVTENKSRPDFLFPTIEKYHKEAYPSKCLTMLGVKSSCKDRWRQILSEADKIKEKHLFTLEPGISSNQTKEMKFNNLQLVLPKALHSTFGKNQQDALLSLNEFINFVSNKQKNCS